MEPEVHFVRDVEVCAPDIAGWRRKNMPQIPKDHRFEIVPDWVCEILSPSTESKDRKIKMPIYAHYGVGYAWLVDPIVKTIEAYKLHNDQWIAIGTWKDNEKASIPPFEAIEIDLSEIWVP